jgi:hypothetical protein
VPAAHVKPKPHPPAAKPSKRPASAPRSVPQDAEGEPLIVNPF